jgi:hypothetical protein
MSPINWVGAISALFLNLNQPPFRRLYGAGHQDWQMQRASFRPLFVSIATKSQKTLAIETLSHKEIHPPPIFGKTSTTYCGGGEGNSSGN